MDAAKKLDIDIPTLCYLDGCAASTSCLACVVKVLPAGRIVPSCATKVIDGMEIESETDDVRAIRLTSLELLLSDHVGDCLAPCWFTCPANMDIPVMLRQIGQGANHQALVTVKHDIALPAVLGRICPAPCEKGCRRRSADEPVTICQLKRYVADVDLQSDDPYRAECKPASGHKVAIVGAGPTGLAAAYYLLRDGHAVTVFDNRSQPGGRLHDETSEDNLPRHVLAAEIAQITRLGAELRAETLVGADSGNDPTIDRLRAEFDAVLVACGKVDADRITQWGLKAAAKGIAIEKGTFRTNLQGVFAAGNAIRSKGMVIRSVADGKEAAAAIDQSLRGQPVVGCPRPFSSRIGRMNKEEISQLLTLADQGARLQPLRGEGFSADDAIVQATRCMHCDCRALGDCRLQRYSAMYGAEPARYKGQRAAFVQDVRHELIIFEPGKCIRCGLCVEIAAEAKEPLGLTFIGRGFDVRVGAPLGRSMRQTLVEVAAQCVAACPTAAMAMREGEGKGK